MYRYRRELDFRGICFDLSEEKRRLRAIMRKTATAIRNSREILNQTNVLIEQSTILIARADAQLSTLSGWVHQPFEKHVHDAEHDRTNEGGTESAHLKSGREQGGGELQHEGVDHKPEDSQGQQR
jgi:hypothetical protein